ncbi:MAG: hypothetical protein NDI61_02540 [Bdellovibrionaceae bacterium]|nr:hypothetical protein [Pseudobdellovibrionaceae bacterium]
MSLFFPLPFVDTDLPDNFGDADFFPETADGSRAALAMDRLPMSVTTTIVFSSAFKYRPAGHFIPGSSLIPGMPPPPFTITENLTVVDSVSVKAFAGERSE